MSDKIAVHLPTQEDYNKYMEFVEKKGWERSGGGKPTDSNYWSMYKDSCCVEFNDRFTNGVMGCYAGYRIISLEEAMREEQAPEFVRGEEVEVWDIDPSSPSKAKYVCTIDHEFPYIVEVQSEKYPVGYKHIRKLPQVQEGTKKFTRQQVQRYIQKKRYSQSIGDILEDFARDHGMLEE